MIEFINARTGEVVHTWNVLRTWHGQPTNHYKGPAREHAAYIAREHNDDIFIRWEAGAGSEAEPDTLVTLEEAQS